MCLSYKETDEPLVFDSRISKVIYYKKSEEEEYENTKNAKIYISHFELIPKSGKNQGRENDIIYISGSSGGGKSHIARMFASNYHRMFPQNRIYYFTMSDESKLPDTSRVWMAKMPDSTTRYHDWMKLKRFHVDARLLDHNFDLETDFSNSLVIFDDFLYFDGGNQKDNDELRSFIVQKVIRIMNLGRKIKVSLILTSHLIYEQKNPDLYKNIFAECHKFIWCVDRVAQRQLTYTLKTHFGLENDEIRKSRKFDPNSHYVCFNKFPRYLQSENKIELL